MAEEQPEPSQHEKKALAEARSLISQMNLGSSIFRRAFVLAMLDEHRQNQGDFFTLMCQMIHGFADTKYYDARNKCAVELSRQIIAAVPRI